MSNKLEVDWDENKNRLNKKNHQGISFEEAATVFNDPLSISVADDEHSWDEARHHIIGESELGRLLVVTYTEGAGKARIISARKPTRNERQDYEEGN